MLPIDSVFELNAVEFKIVRVDVFGDELKFLKKELVDNGKDPAYYYASKILKSGKVSKTVNMFYRFTKSGNMLKVR